MILTESDMHNGSPDFWKKREDMELKYIDSLNQINLNYSKEKMKVDIEKRKLKNEKRDLKNQLCQMKVNQYF